LYVQPLYTLREQGEGTYPVLRYVLVSFGKDVGFGPTLATALDDVLGVTGGEDSLVDQGDPGEPGGPSGEPSTPPGEQPAISGSVRSLLQQAEAKFAEAEQALRDGDIPGYAAAQDEARDLVARALKQAGARGGGDSTGDAGSNAAGDAGADQPAG
jgi:uncharacterized protein